MVPGMAERETLATEMRLQEWLAKATIGPARIGHPLGGISLRSDRGAVLPPGIWRRGLLAASVIGKRISLVHPGTPRVATGNANAPVG